MLPSQRGEPEPFSWKMLPPPEGTPASAKALMVTWWVTRTTGWPATGSRIHHSFGPWPAVIQDYTRVERSEPERELVLKARGWPVGEARVVINLTPTGAQSCRLSIQEDAIAGPGKGLPRTLRQTVIGPRNTETLYRLALIAEGRYRNHDIA